MRKKPSPSQALKKTRTLVTLGKLGGLAFALLISRIPTSSFANPCAGKGTKVFLVNGVFNTETEASSHLQDFANATRPSLSEVRDLDYELAFVEGFVKPAQFALAVAERGLDDFENYWLWLEGIGKAPTWFDELVQKYFFDPKLLNRAALPGLHAHLEAYSKAILDGYEVIIVSHSVGNFYANAALRELPAYVSGALQPPILERSKKNPLYPRTEEMVANVQIGSPVNATVNESPWVNFKDDWVLNSIRRLMKVLPGNIDSPGINPNDTRGHSLTESYLKNSESRNRIIEHLQAAHKRLKYPIPYFQIAAAIRYESVIRGEMQPDFSADFLQDGQEITSVDELYPEKGSISKIRMVDCQVIHPGVVNIVGETGPNIHEIHATELAGDTNKSKEERVLTISGANHTAKWSLGTITVSKVTAKDPLEVVVKFLSPPLSRE